MEATTIKGTNHGPNLRRWREWRNINQEVLAEKIGVSQATLSGYEKKDKLEQEVLEKLAKALEIPVEAITEIGESTSINIVANTFTDFKDNAVANQNYPTFNTVDKIVELYEKLLETEKEKVKLLEEVLKGRG
ncbi:XRE family transcriptional regulator [Apibacter muscae]|uniref:XRE family transcriptional regulator n=1 Tax=Apibacter muscae TaxID=2509004 RepID=A0A563DCF5_9FLAO|nr:helix-turn-helix domain-containing protein [Apibacter muscae]TWP27777.1 XRE family transcriptional regulator [Apibacter muscae]